MRRLRRGGSVFAEEEAALLIAEADSPAALDEMVERRVAGEPLEHIVGWAAFADLRIAVAPGVFVPRRRSELLARSAIARARPHDVVVDLCCGAGPLGAALLAAVPTIVLHAADVDPAAITCARRNLAPPAEVHLGDLYDALPVDLVGRVDLLVANAPYVPTTALALMPGEARHHEPDAALDGGADGLSIHRRIAAGGPRWLRPGGTLLIEVADEQTGAALEAMAAAGLDGSLVRDDELEATVVIARAPDR